MPKARVTVRYTGALSLLNLMLRNQSFKSLATLTDLTVQFVQILFRCRNVAAVHFFNWVPVNNHGIQLAQAWSLFQPAVFLVRDGEEGDIRPDAAPVQPEFPGQPHRCAEFPAGEDIPRMGIGRSSNICFLMMQ